MRKNVFKIIIPFFLVFLIIEILINPSLVINEVLYGFNIWLNNVFPTLFPFIFIGSLLIEFEFATFIGEIFKKIFSKTFNIKKEASFVIILSMLSGFPSSAKYIKDLLEKDILNEKEATKLLMFTHFSNPLFIIGTIGLTFLNNKSIGLLILIIHYLTNFIIAIFIRNYNKSIIDDSKIEIKKSLNKMIYKTNESSLFEKISKSIESSINTMLLILGIIIIFLVMESIITNIFNLSNVSTAILSSLFEITGGLKNISLLNIDLKLKAVFMTSVISFGGFSVHSQVMGILNNSKIKYMPYLLSRIAHALISGLIIYVIFDLFYI